MQRLAVIEQHALVCTRLDNRTPHAAIISALDIFQCPRRPLWRTEQLFVVALAANVEVAESYPFALRMARLAPALITDSAHSLTSIPKSRSRSSTASSLSVSIA